MKKKIKRGEKIAYFVPSLWVETDFQKQPTLIKVNPYEFYSRQINAILQERAHPLIAGNSPRCARDSAGAWSKQATVYNLFVRLTTAFDHDQNGKLDLPTNSFGFRETGSFLKSIALLPYIRRLGANTIHLLPITSIGKDGKKGTLGSPYAIRNPFVLDDNLSEPLLDAGVETEFKAFMEAAHHLGMRVIVEFVFRTAAKDSDWVKEHPEWFYWIKDSVLNRRPGSLEKNQYGSPIFNPTQLSEVKQRVNRGIFSESIPPPKIYREMFTDPPKPAHVKKEAESWIGTLSDGTRVRIPGAFADWPPDDLQPPWDDVTYLKMYRHPEFNYIAYNTIRMYDPRLTERENVNRTLWQTIAEIVPHYQKEYKIDGIMIDMGHALPLALLKEIEGKARNLNPEFAFWEENFNPTSESKAHGYNAAIGYLWSDEQHPKKLLHLFERFSKETFPLPFFGTSESHNSPRAAAQTGGTNYSKFSWTINNFLPVIPFLHAGFELGEKKPVNTGLNFTAEEQKKYPAEKLPLFSESALDWLNLHQFCDWTEKVAKVRAPYKQLLTDSDPSTFKLLDCANSKLCAFERKNDRQHLIVIGNMNMRKENNAKISLASNAKVVEDLMREEKMKLADGKIKLTLQSGEVRILKLDDFSSS